MTMKLTARHMIATVLGALAYLIQGVAIGFLFLNHAYETCTNPGLSKGLEVDLRLIVVASLLISSLFVFAFAHWRDGITGRKGAIAGAIIFLLAGGAFDVATYASTNLYNSPLIIFYSAAGSIIGGAVVGAVTGWWLGRRPTNAQAGPKP
ncbi:MAG: hypothetical protein IPK70_06595 [Flavobacteriales bacterium]|nr:hypothetical protein [Flavobacteriales bacterium]